MPPRWALFDLNGTLLDPSPIGESLGLGPDTGERALGTAVQAAMVDTMSGVYRPLPELLRAALRREVWLSGGRDDQVDAALAVAAAMPAFPDASKAIETLRRAGVQVGVLTNSAGEAAEVALRSAGLDVELVVGSDSVQAYKPDPRIYRAGVEATGAPPGEVCMVAAHWWDLMGAQRAGLRTAWVARKEQVLMPGVDADWTGDDLVGTAAAISSTAPSAISR